MPLIWLVPPLLPGGEKRAHGTDRRWRWSPTTFSAGPLAPSPLRTQGSEWGIRYQSRKNRIKRDIVRSISWLEISIWFLKNGGDVRSCFRDWMSWGSIFLFLSILSNNFIESKTKRRHQGGNVTGRWGRSKKQWGQTIYWETHRYSETGSQSLGVAAVVGETRNMRISIYILPAVYVYFLKHKQLTPSVT